MNTNFWGGVINGGMLMCAYVRVVCALWESFLICIFNS